MTIETETLKDEVVTLQGLTCIEMQAIASKAIQKLNWNLFDITANTLTAYTSKNAISPEIDDKLFLTFDETNGEVCIHSQSSSVTATNREESQQNIQRLKETIEQLRDKLSPEELADLTADLKDMLVTSVDEEEKIPFYTMFIPRKGFMATPILIDINVLIFILMAATGVGVFNPTIVGLLQWGADFGPLTLTGDWWRTLTCNFVHVGIFHILMNMYAFLYIGVLLEPLLGVWKTLVSYLLTGLCSAVCSLFWHSELVSAGASGAIFGLYGIFLSLLLFRCIERQARKKLLSSILIFVAFNLLYGIKGEIDNAAHIGGLLSGLLLGAIYSFDLKRKDKQEKSFISIGGEAGILLIYIIGFTMLTQDIPSDYYEIRNEWDSGLVQATQQHKEQNRTQSVKRISSKSDLPPYNPFTDSDTWLNFDSEKAGILLRYPSNWHTAESTHSNDATMLLQQNWINAGNRLTLTVSRYDTNEAYEYNKKLILSIPRNANGEPSEDYKRSTITINGHDFIQTNNMQHFGAPDEEGYELLQSVLNYFSPKNRMIYTFVMIINDEPAKTDLNGILENVQFSNPQ
ncbi:rhomboid family intramembrane serine protease [Bacteroides sp.]